MDGRIKIEQKNKACYCLDRVSLCDDVQKKGTPPRLSNENIGFRAISGEEIITYVDTRDRAKL